MKSIIRSCDFLGYSPTLNIEGQNRYKSVFTGLLSICVTILGILCTGYFGSALFNRSSPIVVESRDVNSDFGPLQFSSKEFIFLFAMEYDNNTVYSDPTVFEVEAYTMITYTNADESGKISQKITTTNLKTGLCSEFYNQTDIVEKNMILPLDMYYCIEPDTASMSGFWGSTTPYSVTKIIFNRCANSTQNNFTCRPPDQIDQIIQSGYMSIKYTSYDMDQNNFTSPLNRIFYDDFNILNADSSMEYAIEISPLKFNSDIGLVFPLEDNLTGYSSSTRIFTKVVKSNNIFTASFQGNPIGIKYIRSYIKFQTVLTQIGGFIKAIMLIASSISIVFSKNFYFSYFIMKLIPREENQENDGAHKKSFFNSEINLIKNTRLNLNHKNNNHEGNLDIDEEKKSNSFSNDNVKINIANHHKVEYSNKNLNASLKINKNIKYLKSIDIMDYRREITQKYKNETSTSSMFNYLSNKILIFKSHNKKSLNYKLIDSLKDLFKKVLSIDTIFTKTFELEYLKKMNKSKFKKSLGDNVNENNFFSVDTIVLNTLAFNLNNKMDHNTNVFMFDD